MRFFQSLRGKLTLTYTMVTVLALLALEIVALVLLLLISGSINTDHQEYFSDIVITLSPQARAYLQPGNEDLPGLQVWLDDVFAGGYASLPQQYFGDSPPAKIVTSDPMVVIGPDGTVLAQAPANDHSLVGRKYSPPDLRGSQDVLNRAYTGLYSGYQLVVEMPNGKYWMIAPVKQRESDDVLGLIVVTVEPPPPLILSMGPMILGAVMATAAVLLVAVVPFGTLFGFIMSRGLTRRLRALTAAADAWSEGDFRAMPQDRTRDEIGTLGIRMRNMAERIQNLLQTQQALAMMEERNRLARELHDTVKQQTFAMLMQVRAARNLLESDSAAAREHLEDAESLIKSAQKELSLLIAELRPAELEGQGLAGALQGYVDTWSQHTRIPATFQVQNECSLPLAVEQALYRVTQEALANVARHSHASAVNVRLDYSPEQVRVVVSDNGVGFNPQAVQHSGFGLQSMQERLAALGGRLMVQSSAENGTTVIAIAPAKEPASATAVRTYRSEGR